MYTSGCIWVWLTIGPRLQQWLRQLDVGQTLIGQIETCQFFHTRERVFLTASNGNTLGTKSWSWEESGEVTHREVHINQALRSSYSKSCTVHKFFNIQPTHASPDILFWLKCDMYMYVTTMLPAKNLDNCIVSTSMAAALGVIHVRTCMCIHTLYMYMYVRCTSIYRLSEISL